jgi:hypothetical protein
MRMAITAANYVPVLKWRQGEYQALWRLNDALKARVVPLIEVTPPDFDFEEWKPKKTIDEHLEKFATRLKQKWGARPALLDTGLLDPTARMIGGIHPLLWLMEQVRSEGATLIPVTGFDRDAAYQNAVRTVHSIDMQGAALRCDLEDAGGPDFAGDVEALAETIELDVSDIDIVVDLKAPNFEPIDGLAQLLANVLTASPVFLTARSLIITATAFPPTMASITGPIQFVSRQEWLLYRALISRLPTDARRPTFGDYAIAAPDLPQGDMRLLKPSATVRYAVTDGWIIAKGSNVRDNGFEQYRGCCGAVTSSALYLGARFSPGSDYIERCRTGAAKTGNLTTWRWVGTNHHIAKVVYDLANFLGS